MRQRTGDDERGAGRLEARRVKGDDLLERQSTQRRCGADREVPVGMLAVHQAQERALGDRGRRVLQLAEPIEPELAHAIEIGLAQARPKQDVREQRCRRAPQTARASSA